MKNFVIPAEYIISTLIDYEKQYFSFDAISCWEISIIVDKINSFLSEKHFDWIEKYNIFFHFSDEISTLSGKDFGNDFEDEIFVRKNHFYFKKVDKVPFVAYSYPVCQRMKFLFSNNYLMLKFMIEAKEDILKIEKNFFPIEEKNCISLVKEKLYPLGKSNQKIKMFYS